MTTRNYNKHFAKATADLTEKLEDARAQIVAFENGTRTDIENWNDCYDRELHIRGLMEELKEDRFRRTRFTHAMIS